jgi:hypothetical protein
MIDQNQFNPQFGFGELSDGRAVSWEARGRSGSTSKHGGYPVDAKVRAAGEVVFTGAAFEAERWLSERGFTPANPSEMVPDSHQHEIEHMPRSGSGYGVCGCGATVEVRGGKETGSWHACASCTSRFGLSELRRLSPGPELSR